MRIVKKEGKEERKILTAMIVNDSVLARISPKWELGRFSSPWANTIGQWCVDFHNNYGKAPKQGIESLFESWATGKEENETVPIIDSFLQSLSDDYDETDYETNADYIVDQAGRYFLKVQFTKLVQQVEGDLTADKVEDVSDRINNFHPLELGQGEGIDILHNVAAIKALFKEQEKDLVEFPGDLGKFFKGQMGRGCFVAFLAPEKRGKSFWLMDVAWRAMLQRKNVAFFSVGDMSQDQMLRRLIIRATGKPQYPQTIQYPVELYKEDGTAIVETQERVFENGYTIKDVKEVFKKIKRNKLRSKKSYFKLSTHPNSTLSVKGIEAILDGWERNEDWEADVIVIDYADILDLGNSGDFRNDTNTSWKQLRSLSQKKHRLVVTATQSDAGGYDAKLLGMNNFSEDKRKVAHVTAMAGINQTTDEKESNICRLNWVACREKPFNTPDIVNVAECRALGRIAAKSCF